MDRLSDFNLPRSSRALLSLNPSHDCRRRASVQRSVPAAGVVHRGRNAPLQQEAHQAQRGAGSLGGIPQVGGGLGEGVGKGEAAWGAAGGVGRCVRR